MAEEILTADGKPVAIDTDATEREFARVMSAPVTDDEKLAPPKRPVAAAGDAEKPPRKRGRPAKAEQPRVTSAASKAAQDAPGTDAQRAEGVKGFAQIGAGLCLMADARTPETNIAWRADAVTIANAAEPLAAACVEVARSNAAFAAVLDKVTKVGPYGALISVGLGIGAQLARNHGVVAGEMFGAVAPEKLLASLAENDGSPDSS